MARANPSRWPSLPSRLPREARLPLPTPPLVHEPSRSWTVLSFRRRPIARPSRRFTALRVATANAWTDDGPRRASPPAGRDEQRRQGPSLRGAFGSVSRERRKRTAGDCPARPASAPHPHAISLVAAPLPRGDATSRARAVNVPVERHAVRQVTIIRSQGDRYERSLRRMCADRHPPSRQIDPLSWECRKWSARVRRHAARVDAPRQHPAQSVEPSSVRTRLPRPTLRVHSSPSGVQCALPEKRV